VKLGLIKLLHKQFDVCEEACVFFQASSSSSEIDRMVLRRKNNVTVQCPVEPGEYEVVQTVQLPKEIPKGASCA
jgi:hypothetical protein